MRRVMLVLAVLGLTLGVIGAPVGAQPLPSLPFDVSQGSATLTVGPDTSYGAPTWTLTLVGQISVGGQTYVGTVTGNGEGPRSGSLNVNLSGTSSSAALAGECNGTFEPPFVPELIGVKSPVPDNNFTGIIDFSCSISINGAPGVLTPLVVGLLPTSDSRVFNGEYAGTPVPPDLSRLPSVPLISGGLANAVVTGPNFVQTGPSIGFDYSGQLTFGGRTFHGSASGGTAVPALGPTIDIPPFILTGASPTDTLSATCSGKWVGIPQDAQLVGAALALLTCDGSVDGGPPARTTLLSVYRLTFVDAHNNQYSYDGVFAGL